MSYRHTTTMRQRGPTTNATVMTASASCVGGWERKISIATADRFMLPVLPVVSPPCIRMKVEDECPTMISVTLPVASSVDPDCCSWWRGRWVQRMVSRLPGAPRHLSCAMPDPSLQYGPPCHVRMLMNYQVSGRGKSFWAGRGDRRSSAPHRSCLGDYISWKGGLPLPDGA